jgi:TatD DNase family protein
MIRRLVKLGYSFSFGALVTRDNANKCRKAAAKVPAERLLVESDTPDHPAGEAAFSEPASIVGTLEALAGLRRESYDELAALTAQNARALYRC